ncbi:MAG: glutamyl-tRNA reductase [Myxococcota bacterium]
MSKSLDITLYSYSHKNTTTQLRDRLAFSADDVVSCIPMFRERLGVEAGILSTCNRTEIYLFGDEKAADWQSIRDVVADVRGIPAHELPDPAAMHSRDAARHLFRVASSLESIALGEDQILHQVRNAHKMLHQVDLKSPVLDRLFQHAESVGSRVRSDTRLCSGAVSISSIAVNMARRIYPKLEEQTVLIVGAGETGELTATHFEHSGTQDFIVCNRSEASGQALAQKLGARFVPMDQLAQACTQADIAVFATGANRPILNRKALRAAMGLWHRRRLLILDISNPRNVEPDVNKLGQVYLLDIDDLQQQAAEALRERESEIPEAERIIDQQLAEWDAYVQHLRVKPMIVSLGQTFGDVRKQILDSYGPRISNEGDLALLEEALIKMQQKVLHYPIMHLRKANIERALTGQQMDFLAALFHIDEDGDT